MNRKFPGKRISSLLLLILITGKVLANQQRRGSQIPKGCSQLRCEKEEQCISRRFWCKYPPCPQMLYCSKSRKESLKGPSSCSSVRCSKGYVCLVKVRNCTWNKNCKQRIARCVTEREYREGPASCADFQCPQGHRCILRESLCARPPCKVLKSCARSSDAVAWFTECKELGCLSEYDCFLRRPINNCTNPPCKHSPDCILPPEMSSDENCRGWVCPKNQGCLALVLEPCKLNFCKVSRTCKGPWFDQNIASERSNTELKTLNDLEKDWFYQQAEKRRLQAISMKTITPTISRKSLFKNSGYDISRQLFFKPGELAASAQGHNFEFLNSARSVPHVPSVPVYKYPTYLASTLQPRQIFTSDQTTVKSVTTTSAPSWFESLKSRTGIDVINFWVKQAEENQQYVKFQQWLESVRETLDPEMYRLWLEEVRLMTFYSKRFQDWLPLPVQNHNLNIQQFSDFEPKINDMEREVLSAFPRSELDEQPFGMGEYKEENGVWTTLRTVNKVSGDATKYVESSSFNVSKNVEMEKSSVVPTFIIIQPPRSDPNIFDTQQLIQLIHYYLSDHQPQELRVSGHPNKNEIGQIPMFPYLPQNNFPIRQSALPGIHWHNFLNAYPRQYPLMPEINRYLNPFNYLNQYLKPFSRWNHADVGYTHFDQEYPAILNNRPEGIYNQKGFLEIPDSNPKSRKVNWRDYFEKSKFYKGGDEDLRSKIDRLGKPDKKFETNPEFLNEKEKEEQEIQFLLKILQGIIDYDLDGKGREKKENGNENKNDNGNEVLLETLIHMLEEELDESQENIKNPKLENLMDKIEKKGENDSEISENELKKFFDNFSGPLLRRRKGDEIFRSPNISQDSSVSSKTSTLLDNMNSFIEKYSEILSRKDYDNSIENLSKFFDPKEQNSKLNISLQEIQKKENNSPEIIFPKAGYYDFVKNDDLSKKNSTISDNEEIKQTDMKNHVKNTSKNAKKSNDEYEDD